MSGVDLSNLIKKIAINAVESTHPDTMVIGKVITVKPMTIQINEKLTLKENSRILVIPKFIRTMMTPPPPSEKNPHPKADYIKVGDEVILIRTNKGSRYVLMDVI